MKKFLLSLTMVAAYAASMMGSVVLNSTNFPDENFRAFVSQRTGVAEGGTITDAKIAEQQIWTNLGSGAPASNLGIKDMKGIEHFTSLRLLRCDRNQITSLNLSALTNLETLECQYNQLTSLDLSKNTKLRDIECYNNQITSLNLGNNTTLYSLYCESNKLTALNLAGCPNLHILECGSNKLTALDVANHTALTRINCSINQIQSLDVTRLTELTTLQCYSNQIGTLDLAGCTKLTKLECSGNALKTLDLSHNTAITELQVNTNGLACLDASALTLTRFVGHSQHVTMHADEVTRNGAKMYKVTAPGYFVNDEAKGTYVSKRGFGIRDMETVGGVTYFYIDDLYDFQYNYSVGSGDNTLLVTVTPTLEDVITDVVLNEVNFPDPEFRAYITKWTGVADGGILSERVLATIANMRDRDLKGRPIKSLKGIEYFFNLAVLDCGNCQITSLDLSKNKKLTEVMCEHNPLTTLVLPASIHNVLAAHCQLTALDLTGCPDLVFLMCNDNQLTALDITKNPKLYSVDATTNQIAAFDVSHNPLLTSIYVSDNRLTSIDVSKNDILKNLEVAINHIHSIDVSHNPNLERLYCYNNLLENVDVTTNPALASFVCTNNLLTSLDVTKNKALTHLACDGNFLTSIDLSQNTELETLYVDYNRFSTIDLSKNTKLKLFKADHNEFTSLDLSKNVALEEVDLSTNHLMQFDATMLNNLKHFHGEDQSITRPFKANLKTGFMVQMPTNFVNGDTAPCVMSSDVEYFVDRLGGTTTFYPTTNAAFNYTYKVRNTTTGTGTSTMALGDTGTAMHLCVTVSPEKHNFILGDVTGDGIIDIVDVNAILSVLLGEVPPETFEGRADVNGDGIVDVLDLNIVVDIVLGL